MIPQFHGNDVGLVVATLANAQAYSATMYLSPKFVIRATKPRYRKRKKQWSVRDSRLGINLTIGEPNYKEREFIACCKKAGEPFPVKKIQLRDFPRTK